VTAMDIGIALPNHREGASIEGMRAAADAAVRHGWRSLWAIDHLVVARSEAADYGWTLEPLLSLAYLGALYPTLRVATGVLVPPMRDAVQLAKELATLDNLLGPDRLIVGVGVGDLEDRAEYANLGKDDRFRTRGAYLDETIALWRHLWSGRTDPFVGKFNTLIDFTFDPLPARRDELLIISGGRSDRALTRVGRITDGFYASRWGPAELRDRWPTMLATARANGRKRPFLAARVRVKFDVAPGTTPVYAVCGSAERMAGELLAFAEAGTDEFVAVLDAISPEEVTRLTDRFEREVVARFREARARRPDRPAS